MLAPWRKHFFVDICMDLTGLGAHDEQSKPILMRTAACQDKHFVKTRQLRRR